MVKDIEKLAADQQGLVVIKTSPRGPESLGGYEVSIVYPLRGKGEPVWAAWFMALGQHCECSGGAYG